MENDFGTHRPLEGKIKKVTLYSRKKRSTIFEQILELNDEKATIEIVNHNPPGMGDEYLFRILLLTGSWRFERRLRNFLKNQVVTTGSSFS